MILVGNKSDIDSDSERKVSKDEGEAMAKELEIGFRECSAKNRSGIEEVIFDLVRMVKNEVETSRAVTKMLDCGVEHRDI
jgi:Ras-related protein Rab-8A